ncbi:hypothetical protein QEH52_02545 [Coraliomargarita sp. SDUM461003]|uniref:Tfp pilus assembly protein PilX n=1 Tax=Thalassobacterium maritimum TaxID=3041265 RepID=A0ABU1AQE5_9BACT|nr:hypothetical protein [Coraliomargarita sp. SDUM461003]MDQ8206371.1 hypothetical protein [Coraliomargarita sp. SDUM461003]
MKYKSKKGFALVIALGLMAFVLVLMLTITTLVRVESATSQTSQNVVSARQNAYLGVLEAIGKLQQTVGPDQRVTATGALWEKPVVGTEHYLGVWQNLPDAASDTDGNPVTSNGQFLEWLVSRADETETEAADFVENAVPIVYTAPQYTSSSSDYAVLVGAGSTTQDVNYPNTMNGVIAEKKSVPGLGNHTVGNYAWWVGDEGAKAKVNIIDPYEIDSSSDSYLSAFEKARFRTTSAQRMGTTAIEAYDALQLDDPKLQRIIDADHIELIQNGPSNTDVSKRFHDTTVWSKGLMTDVKHGGFKRDLSLLFEMDDSDFETTGEGGNRNELVYNVLDSYTQTNAETLENAHGGPDVTPIFWINQPSFGSWTPGENKFYGPAWHLLRDYYRQYKSVQSVSSTPLLDAVGISPNPSSGDENAPYMGAVRGIYALDPLTDQFSSSGARYPRIVQASYRPYISRVLLAFSIEPVGSDQVEFIMLPVVGLHNPYNISIKISDAHVDWNHLQGRCEIRRYVGEPVTQLKDIVGSGINGGQGLKLNLKGGGGRADVTFLPGQTIFFLPAGGSGVLPWSSREIDLEPLSAGTGLLNAGIALGLPAHFQADPIPTGVDYQPYLEFFNSGSFALYLDNEIQSKIDFFDTHKLVAQGGDYGNLAMASFSPGDMQDEDKAPTYAQADILTGTPHYFLLSDTFVKPAFFPSMHIGFDDGLTDPDSVSSFPSFLLGSPTAMSSSQYTTGGAFHLIGPSYHFVDYYTDASSATNPSNVLPDMSGDGNGYYGAYHDGGGSEYVSFLEIPTVPLHSLGALRHASLAYNDSMPSLAIGNSFQSPSVGNSAAYYDSDRYVSTTVGQIDFSYALNSALLDAYYFSSIAPDSSSNSVSGVLSRIVGGDTTLSNSRMEVVPEEDGSVGAAVLSDYQKNAAYLQVDGMFNVNSTSVEAWKAFLSSMRDLAEIKYVNASNGSVADTNVSTTETAFLRTSLPAGEGLLKGSTDWKNADSWSRFMKLTEAQIDSLATELVAEIKRRAADRGQRSGGSEPRPSLSMAEFINRDLAVTTNSDILSSSSSVADSSQYGILQTAIEKANLNGSLLTGVQFNEGQQTDGSAFVGPDAGGFQNTGLKVDMAASSPNYLTQGDLFQALAPYMSVRSDTFKIRAYGETIDPVSGNKTEAWCEAIVQRATEAVVPAADKWTPDANYQARKFKIVSFRWLDRDDV